MFSEKHDSLDAGEAERELLDILTNWTNWLRTVSGTFTVIRIGFETFLSFFEPFSKISVSIS